MLLLKHKMQLLMTEFIIGTTMSMCNKMFPAQKLILNRVSFHISIPQVNLSWRQILTELLTNNQIHQMSTQLINNLHHNATSQCTTTHCDNLAQALIIYFKYLGFGW